LNFEEASELDDYDIECWIRRFDSDNDKGLNFTDLVSSMEIMTNYKRRDTVAKPEQKLLQGQMETASTISLQKGAEK